MPNDEIGLDNEPSLVLSPAVYDKLNLSVRILLPGISTLYFGLAQIWDFPNPEKIVGTLALLTTLLGSIVAISAKRYINSDARFDGVIIPQVDGGGVKGYSMELMGDPEDLQYKDEISFKVTPKTAPPEPPLPPMPPVPPAK